MASLKGEIDDNAIRAAINFVEICCQQAAFIAGRGNIKEEIDIIQASKFSECKEKGHAVLSPLGVSLLG